MNTNTGGSAFPVRSVYIEDQETNSHGMTLRDYFAAKAIQGLCAKIALSDSHWIESTAKKAYEMADAMLKAREA